MEVDYRELEYLRKHTLINPIRKMKVLALREEAEKECHMMKVYENYNPGIDYSKADALEYFYRMEAWARSMIYYWVEYDDSNLTLDDFARKMLHQAMREKSLIR